MVVFLIIGLLSWYGFINVIALMALIKNKQRNFQRKRLKNGHNYPLTGIN